MNRKLATMLAVAGIVASSAAAQPGRTAYEIDVFGASSKSQGLRGILYDEQGRRIAAGAPVEMQIGSFAWIPCRMLWETCGRWRTGQTPPRSSYPQENRSVQRYRVSFQMRDGEAYWTGQLVGLSAAVTPDHPVETPMGAFRWTSGQLGTAHWQGWVPDGWPDLPLVPAR